MANYAFLDENNIVTEVISGTDETELLEGIEPEIWYGDFRKQACKRTSYNTRSNIHLEGKEPFRGNYAGIGYLYDELNDVFIPPQPFDSWTLNKETWQWDAPVAYPNDGRAYFWDEPVVDWTPVNDESATS